MTQKLTIATACMLSEFERIRPTLDSEKAIIVTPDILRTLDYHLPKDIGTVIFMGFDKLSPLRIPTATHFHKDVWIVDCIVKSMTGIRIDGNLNYITTEFELENDVDYIGGIITMDTSTWEAYREERISSRKFRSRTVKISEDEGNNSQVSNLKLTLIDVPYYSVLRYLNDMKDIEVVYNKKTDTYVIEGNVILQGPYTYTFPTNTTFTGDLTLVDFCYQPFPESVKVDGEVRVLSYFI